MAPGKLSGVRSVFGAPHFQRDSAKKKPSENKQLFLQYTSHIREMAEEVEKYERKQEMQAEACATGDQGCLMVEFGDFQGRSMKDVYEDQSKEAQALIRYLVKADARPNTNMAILKTYVLKRRASAAGTSVRQPARPPAASSASAPPPAAIRAGVQQTATVKALLARGKHLSPSQVVRKLMSPVKPCE